MQAAKVPTIFADAPGNGGKGKKNQADFKGARRYQSDVQTCCFKLYRRRQDLGQHENRYLIADRAGCRRTIKMALPPIRRRSELRIACSVYLIFINISSCVTVPSGTGSGPFLPAARNDFRFSSPGPDRHDVDALYHGPVNEYFRDHGTYAELRNAINVASVGGILVSGILTLIPLPVLYHLFARIRAQKKKPSQKSANLIIHNQSGFSGNVT